MSEKQLKAADADAATEEEAVEEISEEDLDGVAGGVKLRCDDNSPSTVFGACTCGEDNCDCMSCDTEATAD